MLGLVEDDLAKAMGIGVIGAFGPKTIFGFPFRGFRGEMPANTAKVLGARGALLSVLAHFFEQGHWELPIETGIEGQNLSAEDQLFILMQAGLYLSATRGYSAPEVRVCYERVESLCHSLNRPMLLYSALTRQFQYSLVTDKLTATMRIAQRIYALAQEQDDCALMIGANRCLAVTFYYTLCLPMFLLNLLDDRVESELAPKSFLNSL